MELKMKQVRDIIKEEITAVLNELYEYNPDEDLKEFARLALEANKDMIAAFDAIATSTPQEAVDMVMEQDKALPQLVNYYRLIDFPDGFSQDPMDDAFYDLFSSIMDASKAMSRDFDKNDVYKHFMIIQGDLKKFFAQVKAKMK